MSLKDDLIQSAVQKVKNFANGVSSKLSDREGWFRGGQFTPVQQIRSIQQQSPVQSFGPLVLPNFRNQQVQSAYKPIVPYVKKFGEGFGESSTYGLIDIPNAPSQNLGQKVAYGAGFVGGMINPLNPLNKAMGALNIGGKVVSRVAPKMATKLGGKILGGGLSELAQAGAYTGAQKLLQKPLESVGLAPENQQSFGTNLAFGLAGRGLLSNMGRGAIASGVSKVFKDQPYVSDFKVVNEALQRLKTMSSKQNFDNDEMGKLVSNAKMYSQKLGLATPKEFNRMSIQKQYDLIANKLENMIRSGDQPIMGITDQSTKGVGAKQLGQTTIEPPVLPKAQPEIPQRPSNLGSVQDNQSALTGNIPQGKVKIKTGLEKTPNQRAFLENVSTSEKTSEPLIQQTKLLEQTYEPITNKQSIAQARSIINKSADEAKNLVYSNAPTDNIKITTGIELAKRYEKQGNIDDSIDLINELDRQLREAGRGIQAASLWNKMSPETLVRTANRIAEKNKQALSKEVQGNILARMRRVSKMVDGAEKDNATLDVLNYIADNVKPGIGEIFDAYRYTNMLSNPKSHERNIYGNLFNTLVTRPLDIGLNATYDFIKNPINPMVRDIHFSDVPRYYKNVFTSLGSALNASKEALKGSNLQFDATGAESAIEALRREKVPGVFKAIPKFMQAQDQFFSTLIAAGEKARLMKKGLSEEQAISQATKIADKYLLKERLGASDAGYIVKALDSLGKLADSGRKLPVIGKAWGWFVPFIKTPVNFAKLSVEHSLLNLPGAKINTETLAKATAGSLFMAYAGKLAMEDRTTLSAPTDAKQKELFYASGKKPFSVRIGDTWVPMTYFGPFGAAMMIPAAMKQRFENDPGSYTDDVALKSARVVGDISKYLASQTPLKGIGDFVSLLDGDSDFTLQSILGGMASQAIPLAGMNRWINGVIDDTYRKGSDLKSQILKSVPGGTLNMEAYTTPTGEESKRLPENRFLPYDIGRSDEKYAGLEQQRLEKLQSNKEENLLKKQLEQGKSGGVSGDKIAYINENGTPTILDLSKYDKVAELPSTNKYQQAIKESKQYSEAAKILDNTALSQEQQQTALTRLGIDPDKASYYQVANDNDNLKTMFVLDAVNKVKSSGGGFSDVLSLLANQRTEVNGKMIASNGVIDNLVDEGILTYAQAKELKKYKFENGQLVKMGKAKVAKGKKIKIPKLKKIKVKAVKIKKLKKLKFKPVKLAKPKKIKVRRLANT